MGGEGERCVRGEQQEGAEEMEVEEDNGDVSSIPSGEQSGDKTADGTGDFHWRGGRG